MNPRGQGRVGAGVSPLQSRSVVPDTTLVRNGSQPTSLEGHVSTAASGLRRFIDEDPEWPTAS
jgi:hypothetical protein